jgi:hypothetical protein
VKAKAVVQCLLFSASPKAVVRTMESLGVVRAEGRWRSWWYPSFSSPTFSCWVLPARQKDSDWLGVGDTIESHIVGDLTLDSWQQWLTSLAHAARISDAEAARLIEEKTIPPRPQSPSASRRTTRQCRRAHQHERQDVEKAPPLTRGQPWRDNVCLRGDCGTTGRRRNGSLAPECGEIRSRVWIVA